MVDDEELIYSVKFSSFLDRFLNNSYFKLMLFFEILILIACIYFLIKQSYLISIILIIIMIIINYLNKYKINFYKYNLIIPDSKIFGGDNELKINYYNIKGYYLKNNSTIIIYYLLSSKKITLITIRGIKYLEKNQISQIFIDNKIPKLNFEESKSLFKKTLIYKLIWIIPIGLLIDLSLIFIISIIIYLIF